MKLMRRPAQPVIMLALAFLAACTTAKQGGAADESATSVARAERRAPFVRPETLPISEPTMQRTYPTVPLPAADTVKDARATIARLERDARAIAHNTGCSSAHGCRTAAVGVRACGGPRTFIVYCAQSTDTIALMRTLRELERVEQAYNERSGMMGTCEMRLAPQTALVGGVCREKPASP